MSSKNRILWVAFAFFAIGIGCYPLIYLLVDMHDKGLLQSKSPQLLHDRVWTTFFYIHISFGGLALLTGWQQFSNKIRQWYLNIHRWLGRVYVVAVLLSGTAGLYIAYYASGGLISILGFGLLALLFMLPFAFSSMEIIKVNVSAHQKWMTRNYALTFAAVTLRIWLPLMLAGFHVQFLTAYPIVAWLCWVPNLLIAEIFIVNRKDHSY